MEKAYLVTISPMTRVIAQSEDEAIQKAIQKMKSDPSVYISTENVEEIKEDTEMPYVESQPTS